VNQKCRNNTTTLGVAKKILVRSLAHISVLHHPGKGVIRQPGDKALTEMNTRADLPAQTTLTAGLLIHNWQIIPPNGFLIIYGLGGTYAKTCSASVTKSGFGNGRYV